MLLTLLKKKDIKSSLKKILTILKPKYTFLETNIMLISFIIPTLNEEKYLKRCLTAIENMSIGDNKKEIIIIDAQSKDRTIKIANREKCKVVINKNKTVGWARYLGFKNSSGNLVIFLDADCLLDKNWFKENYPILKVKDTGGVGGSTVIPNDETSFGKAVDFVLSKTKIFTKTLHTKEGKFKETNDLPGSNCLYKREVLDKVMPVALDVLTADDVILNFKIKSLGYKLYLNPKALAYHYRRTNFKKLFIQMYRFAIGRLQVGKKNIKLINFSHILVGLALPLIILYLLFFYKKIIFLAIIAILFIFILFVFSLIKSRSLIISFLAPFIIIDVIFSWSLGFLRELIIPVRPTKTD